MWSTSRASGRADARSLRTVETRRGVVANGDLDILAAARGPPSPADPVPAGCGGRDLRPAQPHPGARSRAYVCLLARADGSTFMEAFLLSTGVVFLAELGDKSQLMALTFAARFRARTVLIGGAAAPGAEEAWWVARGVGGSIVLSPSAARTNETPAASTADRPRWPPWTSRPRSACRRPASRGELEEREASRQGDGTGGR